MKKINIDSRNIYNIFKRKSIDTELLEKIGEILEYDFFKHYTSKKLENVDSEINVVSEPSNIYTTNAEIKRLSKRNELLENEIKILHDRLADKELIIEYMRRGNTV